MRGKFITLEGVDGAGKSIHLEWIAQALRALGHRVAVTREPGGSSLAEKLRELILHEPMDAITETLLVFAARDDHLRTRVVPALEAGTWVVCDRFTDATVAYQGGGKGVDRSLIDSLRQIVHPGLRPDRTLVFDCPYAIGRDRMVRARKALDRFEREGQAFFERVRSAYLDAARSDPERIEVIDSTQSLDEIRAMLRHSISSL